MNPTPIDSLNFLVEILRGLALPMQATDGRLSHNVVNAHVQNIFAALQPKPEPATSEPKPEPQAVLEAKEPQIAK
jgi:hypothetical protein